MLYFGKKGRRQRLGLETRTEPVEDTRLLLHLVASVDDKHGYPLTIEERTTSVEVDAVVVDYRILAVGDDLWCGASPVGERWLFLKGVGVPAGGDAE